MTKDIVSKARSAMDKAIESLKKDFTKVRTGRASVSLLDDVRVDYYGTPTPLSQLGTLAIPEPRLITIQPWEKKLLPEIEKAIFKADLGLTPSSDGQLIRMAIPPLTEDRRKEMVKMLKRMVEDTKVAVRNVRRDANDAVKKLAKDKEISEDDAKRVEKEIQDLTDKFVAKADEVVAVKEKEVMEI
ncbi:ribosome recycling factor [Trichloromonas acetexigens]|jgi:ribosome recycling factor|uniref:Ribosome-recycling factor n=1 Tax=Trichloromonas acetexigens TaxID=38815 RepID=A0A550JLH7_9BACT|nr:ribosome recycling factor [Desulfuromonas acetexigens]TRO84069.1 ribosome recycling factor [Desulfuromonas acetexigens]